jgi:hypothetical protein
VKVGEIWREKTTEKLAEIIRLEYCDDLDFLGVFQVPDVLKEMHPSDFVSSEEELDGLLEKAVEKVEKMQIKPDYLVTYIYVKEKEMFNYPIISTSKEFLADFVKVR